MAKQLNAEQKTIAQIFTECKTAFLIPEYQRPYSWERDECRTLWDNLYEFAFPDESNVKNFDKDEEAYFVGTILTFKNASKEFEVIDGQQRLVTFMLMLRAFYEAFGSAQELPPLGAELQIEHILPKKRQELHNVLSNPELLETLGNKSLLEKTINIRAADYRLVDKKVFYLGDSKKAGTFNLELRRLSKTHDDFTEADILKRNEEIFDAFLEYLRGNDLLI